MNLKGKKILFFSVSFFGYEAAITEKLESLGADVSYYDERPSNTVLTKGLIRLNPTYLKTKIQKYYRQILVETSKQEFDYIFIIKGEVLPAEVVQQLKTQNPGAITILYLWDSLANNGNAVELMGLMDRAFSFDFGDCSISKLKFRPLFFLDDYGKLDYKENEFDLLFVCTAHTDRYKLGKHIEKAIVKNGFKMYGYYYLQNPLVYFYKKIFEKEFENVEYRDMKFKSLSKDDILNHVRRSRAILDVQHPRQQGLTMRSIETIGARKKLLTTNDTIKEYDFYHPDNIQVIDRKNPEINFEFFNRPYHPIDQEIINYYSLEGWINTLFSIEESQTKIIAE